MGLSTQVWHQYPDISLLLNFYRESKFAVRFFLGAFVFEKAKYFPKSPTGGSDKYKYAIGSLISRLNTLSSFFKLPLDGSHAFS